MSDLRLHAGKMGVDGSYPVSLLRGDEVLMAGLVNPYNEESVKAFVERVAAELPGIEVDDLRRELLALAKPKERVVRPVAPASIDPYRPFPVDALVDPMRQLVLEGAASIGCDVAYLALPLMAGLSAAVGNARAIELKPGWTEPAVLWTAAVAASGNAKSPTYELALRAIHRRQHELWSDHRRAVAEYRAALKEWKSAPRDDRGEEPAEPAACEHLYCGDATVEALGLRLCDSARGILVCVDELAGWFKGWNAYKSGGGDREAYLSFYDAKPMKIDRKASEPPTIIIPRAFVAVTGCIQPGILRRLMTDEQFECGLMARFLMARPPEMVAAWHDQTVSEKVKQAVGDVYARLWGLRMQDGCYGPEPVVVPVTEAAQVSLKAFINRNGEEQRAMDDDRLKAAWAKLRAVAARIALVLHFSAWAAGVEGVDERAVDETSVRGGIMLADWFGHEARRLYGMLGEDDEQRQRRELVDLIRDMGGRATVTDLKVRRKRYQRDATEAHSDLDALVAAGFGRWEWPRPGPKGGHPAKVFILREPGGDTETGTPDIDPASGGCGFGIGESGDGKETSEGGKREAS